MRVDLAKVRELRRKAGLTQADMAVALGYRSAVGYFYLERGRCRVTVERLGLIAQALGVQPGDLLTTDKNMTGRTFPA